MWMVRSMNLLHREFSKDQDSAGILKGDVYEIAEPPVYEVDPVTQKTKPGLQCFLVENDDLDLKPVSRGSWLKHWGMA